MILLVELNRISPPPLRSFHSPCWLGDRLLPGIQFVTAEPCGDNFISQVRCQENRPQSLLFLVLDKKRYPGSKLPANFCRLLCKKATFFHEAARHFLPFYSLILEKSVYYNHKLIRRSAFYISRRGGRDESS